MAPEPEGELAFPRRQRGDLPTDVLGVAMRTAETAVPGRLRHLPFGNKRRGDLLVAMQAAHGTLPCCPLSSPDERDISTSRAPDPRSPHTDRATADPGAH